MNAISTNTRELPGANNARDVRHSGTPWLLLICLALGSLLTLFAAGINSTLPYQTSYEEGNELNAAVRILSGETAYPAPGTAPYVFNPYGPVFYGIVAAVLKLFGITFIAPRLLTVFSAVGVSLLVGLLVEHWTDSRGLAVSFGLLYLSMPLVSVWAAILRPDLMGTAFTLAGLYVFAVMPGRWLLSIPFFVLALFVKPTFLAAPMACFLYLLARRGWTNARRFILATALIGTVAFACAELYTGKWLAFHLFWTHQDAYSLATWEANVAAVFLLQAAPIALSLWFLGRTLLRRSLGLPVLYFGCSLAIMMFTAGKVGSNHNHGLEFLAAASLCAGLALHSLAEHMPKRFNAVTFVVGMFALGSSVLVAVPQFRLHTNLDGCRRAYSYVRNHPGDRMLSENVGALVLAHKPVLVSNPFVYNQLIRQAGWSDAALTDRIRAKSFDLILLGNDWQTAAPEGTSRWSASVLAAVKDNYRVVEQFDCRDAAFALEPKPFVPSLPARQVLP